MDRPDKVPFSGIFQSTLDRPSGPVASSHRRRHVWAVQNHKLPEWGSSLVCAGPLCLRHGPTLTRDRRKIPWRLSPTQKFRQRKRLRAVDQVIATVTNALAKKGETLKSLERWKSEMPTEAEMLPRDKYTMFDRKAKRYRKGIHSTWLSGGCVSLCACLADIFGVRTPQVDPCVAENQPAWFLDDEERWFWRVYPMYYTNCNKRRYDGINSVAINGNHGRMGARPRSRDTTPPLDRAMAIATGKSHRKSVRTTPL